METACQRMEWLDPFYQTVWKRAYEERIPISGTFELTPRCNFNCKMCYVHLKEQEISKYGAELSAKEWLRIAEEVKEAGTTWLCITGGEPLTHPEFPIIWERLSKMGFFLSLQTNGSLINGEILKLLENYPPRQAKITLYGTDDGVYEEVCGVKQGFTRVNDGIHTLMSMGIPVTLVSTVIRQNADDVQKMAFYAYRHRLPWLSTVGVRPSMRGGHTDLDGVWLQEKLEESRRKTIKRRMKEHNFLDPDRKLCSYCKDYRLGYWILWDGTVSFCSFLNDTGISICKLPFRKAWSKLLDYEEMLEMPQDCKVCEAAKICERCTERVKNRKISENGSENFCEQMKRLYEESNKE